MSQRRHARVFGSRISPFVEKVIRALALKGYSYELIEPRNPLDFRRWNPQTGKMPVVEMEERRFFDSTFILRELDLRAPEPPLMSDDAHDAARQRLLEDWSDESLYWYGMALRWAPSAMAATTAQIVADIPFMFRPIAQLMVPRQIRPSTLAQGLGRLPEETVLTELAGLLDDLVTLLDERPFFFGDRPSRADLALFGQFHMLRTGPTPRAAALLDERPALLALEERIETATKPV